MKYIMQQRIIEYYPINSVNCNIGRAEHVKEVRFEDIGVFYSEMSYTRGDCVVDLDGKEWVISTKVLILDRDRNYTILLVEPYDGRQVRQTIVGTIESWIPLIRSKEGSE